MSSDASSADASLLASVVVLVPAWRVDRTFDYAVPPALAERVRPGILVRVPFGHRKVRGIVVGVAPEGTGSGRALEAVGSVVLDAPLTPPPLDELFDWLARRYVVTRAHAFARAVPSRVRVTVGERAGNGDAREPKAILGYSGGNALVQAIESGLAGTHLVRTVPGEDRGALIAELVGAAARADGGAALVLVPEVKYGSTTLERLTRDFPGFARVDSAQPEPERAAAWMALARGAPFGGGGRAAVLAPAPRLRLVVVDEEHHDTYKEDRSPKYDARRVALERAQLQGAVCVLLSPSPTVESGAAALSGAIGSVEPARDAARSARPLVELIDTPRERSLSHEVHDRIRSTLRDGGRVGLLVPARGYARALWCATCRRSLRCPRCEAGMAFDRSEGRVRCPHCGLVVAPPSTCPSCGAADWRYMGAGSERLAEQVALAFPHATVARVDPGSLGDESARDAQIYVTTWIGTKEVLRPEVSMVAVLDADGLIRRPDFRAAEHAYQALAEMAEWAGAAAEGGRLLIQTSEPGHHALQAIVRADYRFFLERELPFRKELRYPPFSELVRATAFGPRADELVRAVAAACEGEADVLGPMAARVDGRRDPNARELLAKCRDALAVAERLRDILASVPAGNRLSIDVDPR